jgi:hypothetical protein
MSWGLKELIFCRGGTTIEDRLRPARQQSAGVCKPQIHRLIPGSLEESVGLVTFLITSKASDARRQGATSEAYGAIRRKEERSQATPLELCEIPFLRGDDVLLLNQGQAVSRCTPHRCVTFVTV